MKKVFDLKRKADNVVTSSPQQPNQPQPTNQPTMSTTTLPARSCYYLGKNYQGKSLYLGKKNSDDPHSRDLTLWYTVGIPKIDGSNYVRVPADAEVHYCHSLLGYTFSKWVTYLRTQLCAPIMSPASATRIQNHGEQHPLFHSRDMKEWRRIWKQDARLKSILR